MNPLPSTAAQERSRFIIRDAASINRLLIQVLTRWTLPRVEIRIESLPAVVVQLAQHRIAQILETPNGGLGVVLAASTLLIGIYVGWSSFQSWIWTAGQFWQHLVLVAIAALYVGLIGKGIGGAMTRVKLLRVLLGLRRRLVAGKTFKEPTRYAGRDVPRKPVAIPVTTEAVITEDDNAVAHTMLSRTRAPRVLIRNIADIKRLLVHLFTHLRLPRVQIGVDGVAPLDVQRAQHRIARLSEACNCMLGAFLAAIVILGGAFSVQWMSSQNWDWMVPVSWGPLGLVPVVAMGAALTGVAIEMIWTRVKLMLVVRAVRHRLGT